MKYFIFLVFIAINFSVFSRNYNPISYQVVSEEVMLLNGELPIKVKLKFKEDSIHLKGNILSSIGFTDNFILQEQNLDTWFNKAKRDRYRNSYSFLS